MPVVTHHTDITPELAESIRKNVPSAKITIEDSPWVANDDYTCYISVPLEDEAALGLEYCGDAEGFIAGQYTLFSRTVAE